LNTIQPRKQLKTFDIENNFIIFTL